MRCIVLLPNGKIALGKLAQALMYGATTISIEGNFDEALRIVRDLDQSWYTVYPLLFQSEVHLAEESDGARLLGRRVPDRAQEPERKRRREEEHI